MLDARAPAPVSIGRVDGKNIIAVGCVKLRSPGASHMLGQPHPRLRQCQPQGFVLLVARSLRHGDTFFRTLSMILRGPHRTLPDRTRHQQISIAKCGGETIPRWPKTGIAKPCEKRLSILAAA